MQVPQCSLHFPSAKCCPSFLPAPLRTSPHLPLLLPQTALTTSAKYPFTWCWCAWQKMGDWDAVIGGGGSLVVQRSHFLANNWPTACSAGKPIGRALLRNPAGVKTTKFTVYDGIHSPTLPPPLTQFKTTPESEITSDTCT